MNMFVKYKFPVAWGGTHTLSVLRRYSPELFLFTQGFGGKASPHNILPGFSVKQSLGKWHYRPNDMRILLILRDFCLSFVVDVSLTT